MYYRDIPIGTRGININLTLVDYFLGTQRIFVGLIFEIGSIEFGNNRRTVTIADAASLSLSTYCNELLAINQFSYY